MASGYYDSSGTDLDSLFDVTNSGTEAFGFQISSGQDLGHRYPNGSLSRTVGYASAAGTDIGYLRTKKAAPIMAGYNASIQEYMKGTNTVSIPREREVPSQQCHTATDPRCCIVYDTIARPGVFKSGVITVRGSCRGFNYGDVGWRVRISTNRSVAATLALGTNVPALGTVTRSDLFGSVWSNTQDADLQPNYRTIDYEFNTDWSTAAERTLQFSFGAYISGGYYLNKYCSKTRENINNVCRLCHVAPGSGDSVQLTVSQMFYNSVGSTGWYSNTIYLVSV